MALMIKTNRQKAQTTLPDLTDDEIKKFNSIADAIRYVSKKYPDASNGSIAKLLSKYHPNGNVRPQHVYNVLHQIIKRK